ncbi:MAG: NirD/YgiW/YdeI family stress tolerance protein [Treponema sp.]|jgi:uncharacterized protein (TIGR00156 family)|nr:NirD/YgiW/YdeI family stress tolerance protein [Treponema sp.]
MNGKPYVYAALVAACTGAPLHAQEGDKGRGADIVMVAEASAVRDEYPVPVQGTIERLLGDETYRAAGAAGVIMIAIDDRLRRGISVDQNGAVDILGEIDRVCTRIEIKARGIKKM